MTLPELYALSDTFTASAIDAHNRGFHHVAHNYEILLDQTRIKIVDYCEKHDCEGEKI